LGDGAGVGADHTDFEGLGDAPDPVRVLGEEVTREADLGVVGERLRASAGSASGWDSGSGWFTTNEGVEDGEEGNMAVLALHSQSPPPRS
jgi:hypothetical protein